MEVDAVLFDLDGTIIDSYAGIQSAFDIAYLHVYGKPNTTSIKSIIGPPIGEILVRLNQEQDVQKVDEFIEVFKHHYDSLEFKKSTLYEGMNEVLIRLNEAGIKLYIATNKRLAATKLILNYLNIINHFSGVYSSDSKSPAYSSKEVMVADILKTENLQASNTVLIGDTYQDEIAAKFNGIKFIYADYGFGNLSAPQFRISKPLEALSFINSVVH